MNADQRDQRDQRVRRLERRLERARAAQRESERIAEGALRRLYEANELKTVLLGTVNHELRTPATVIRGYAHSLLTGWDELDDADRRLMVERMATSAEGLAGLVEEVLGLAQLEAGAMAGEVESVPLAPLLEAACDEVAEGRSIETRLDVDTVLAHPAALRRILVNLLANAVRYSPPEAPVVVACAADDGHAELVVQDGGPGIDDAERGQVFEPFFRGRGDHVLRTSGIGIGLTVVQRLVSLHSGEVLVLDAPGGGTRFVVRLPQDVTAYDDEGGL